MLVLWHQPLIPFGAVLTPIAGLAIAIRIFDVRSYTRWQWGRAAPLGVRMVRACSDGMSWPLWWWRIGRHRTARSTAIHRERLECSRLK